MALVTVFAEARWTAIKAAVKEKKDWPAEWLSDLHAAYAVLQRHPLGTDGPGAVALRLPRLARSRAPCRPACCAKGSPASPSRCALHATLRERLLKFRGVRGSRGARTPSCSRSEDPTLGAFAGLASFEAAEQLRRTRAYDQALEAYARSVAHYEQALAAGHADAAAVDHAVALALAGRARVAYQMGDDERALDRHPRVLRTRSGLRRDARRHGHHPRGDRRRCCSPASGPRNAADLALPLEQALASLDAELLSPDIGLMPREGE